MSLSFSSPSSSLLASIALVLLGVGCGSAAPPVRSSAAVSSAAVASSDPCRGSNLVLADVLAHCRVDQPYAGPPDARELRVDADPVTLTSGSTAQVTLTFENATSAPLEVWMDRPSMSFETSLWQGQTRVDQRRDAATGGGMVSGCSGDCRAVRVVIEPGGYIRGAVDLSARVAVLSVAAMDGALEQVVPHDGGPLAPGAYELAVSLPWADRDAQSAFVGREMRTTCSVVQ